MEEFGYEFITKWIPHRPPFLWLDRVFEIDPQHIKAEKTIPRDLDIFQGHYPAYPIMPGVLLCEAVFQAGTLLLARRENSQPPEATTGFMPVLTRIVNARFKREVHPGDCVEVLVDLKEQVGSAWFLKGTVRLHGKLAVQVEFACMNKKGD